MRRFLVWSAVVLLSLALGGFLYYSIWGKTSHTAPRTNPSPVAPSGDSILDSINRGIEFLKVYQEPDGHFSKGTIDPKPALTALVVEAVMSAPNAPDPANTAWLQKAIDAILSCQQPDGGFYSLHVPIGNYCTAVSIMALVKVDRRKYETQLRRAADYIMGIQHKDASDPDAFGGYGYYVSSRPDLSNTVMAIEALRDAGVPADSPSISLALKFISRCQNNTETNPLDWVLNDGGFIYRPGDSKAGRVEGPNSKKGFRSYGLMTYAGLLSMAYAEVDREDPRVKSALSWVAKNYSVTESVGLGDAGLFYYYRTMAKALAAMGLSEVETDSGKHNWARDISEAIISKQDDYGGWANTNAEWLEDDPVLVTAYCVRTLSYCYAQLKGE